jgi:eukaryotic-like serine/threonine-protein kinase
MEPGDTPAPELPDDRTVTYRPTAQTPAPPHPSEPFRADPGWTPELEAFARNLVRLGLAHEAELRAVLIRLTASPRDVNAVAQTLVRAEILTGYQAGAVLQGKTKGLILGNYVVLDKLGAGGMGMVFKVRHRKLGRVVALKILPPSVTNDPSAVLRFEREVKVAAQLDHPNIVGAIDADEFQGLHFLVMEFVEGRDLGRVLVKDGPLPLDRALDVTIQAARGLRFAHAQGIIHRDIKPTNLILDSIGTVKVLDMGLARFTGDAAALHGHGTDGGLTQAGSVMGTADFMSPEQAYDPKAADERSDIYSLGCTLYYLLTGQVPFGGETFVQRVLAHRTQPIPSIPDASPALNGVLHRLMAKEPAERPQSMDEVIAALQSLGKGDVAVDEPEIPQHQSARPWIFVSLAAALLISALVGVFVLNRPRPVREVVEARRSEPPPPPLVAKPPPPAPPPKVETKPEAIPTPPPARPEPIGFVTEFKGHTARVDSVAIDRSGRYAVSGGYDDTVRLWDLHERKLMDTETHVGPVFGVSFTNQGSVLSAGQKGRARLWDMKGHHEIQSFTPGTEIINAVACSPKDADLGVTGGFDRKVRIWQLDKGREQTAFPHDDIVTTLAFLPDGHSVLSGGGVTVWQWDLDLKAQKIRLDVGYRVFCLAPSPDGNRVLVGGENGALALWELGKGVSTRLEGHHSDVMSCAFLSDTLVVSGDVSGDTNDGRLILWDLQKPGEIKWQSKLENAGHRGIAVLPDRRHILTADNDGLVRLWNLPVGVDEQGR